MASSSYLHSLRRRMGIARDAYRAHNYNFAREILTDIVGASTPGMTRSRELVFASHIEAGDVREAFRLLGGWAQEAVNDVAFHNRKYRKGR